MLLALLSYVITFQLLQNTWDELEDKDKKFDLFGTNSSLQLVSFSTRLLTFVLSAYVLQIMGAYFKGAKDKARRMNYAFSKVVDILSVTLNYQHRNSASCMSELHRSLCSIGHYGLTVVATSTAPPESKDKVMAARRQVFAQRGLNSDHLAHLPPKQALHVLRLAILQTISEERTGGCLSNMTAEDFVELRSRLNDYCGGASQVSASMSSNKLPFAYVNLVNCAVKVLTFFYTVTFYAVAAEDWEKMHVCIPIWEGSCEDGDLNANYGMWATFIWFNVFQLMMLYFLFGILELYVIFNDTWRSGLVQQNYCGIIDLIAEPLTKRPLNVRQLSVGVLDGFAAELAEQHRRSSDIGTGEVRRSDGGAGVSSAVADAIVVAPGGMTPSLPVQECRALIATPLS